MEKIFRSEKNNYCLYGFLFGCLFPLVSAFVQLHHLYQGISIKNILLLHLNEPLLLIIDTVPFFLGVFAMFGGIQLDRINDYNDKLVETVESTNAELDKEYQINKELIIEKADACLEAADSKAKLEVIDEINE